MYKHYYYNTNTDNKGNHEVHTGDCSYLPEIKNRNYIGYKDNCKDAIKEAKEATGKTNFDGCYYCCNPCHKG
ncbi:MAG: hypothetical protein PHN55_11045 [Dysgonamonadaceae bacterium]|nr:hypothetical protein [Dysgonamonadaceae bacterium]